MGIQETLLENATLLQTLPFKQGCEKWLEGRGTDISPKTRRDYSLYIDTLDRSFGGLTLPEITGDLLREHQKKREADGVSNAYINQECGLLRLIRKDMHMEIRDYKPRKVEWKEVGHALTDEERARLFRIARENPNWYSAYLFARIAVETSTGPKETFGLKIKHCDFYRSPPSIWVEGTKNRGRRRRIVLSEDAMQAVQLALERAKTLGSTEPDHYVFPRRLPSGKYDPTLPQVTCKTAWSKLRCAAKMPWLRRYDMRHTFITVALEQGRISERTIEKMAGHLRPEMKDKYSHFRLEAQMEALEAMAERRIKPYLVKPRELKSEEPPKKQGMMVSLADLTCALKEALGKK